MSTSSCNSTEDEEMTEWQQW